MSSRAILPLRTLFTVAPLISGSDKFTRFLGPWERYVAPQVEPVASRLTVSHAVGVTEVAMGVGMMFRPRVFSRLLGAWLFGSAISTTLTGRNRDVAFRDFGLAVAAWTLGRVLDEQDVERQVGRGHPHGADGFPDVEHPVLEDHRTLHFASPMAFSAGALVERNDRHYTGPEGDDLDERMKRGA